MNRLNIRINGEFKSRLENHCKRRSLSITNYVLGLISEDLKLEDFVPGEKKVATAEVSNTVIASPEKNRRLIQIKQTKII
jgi:hypothetical protein